MLARSTKLHDALVAREIAELARDSAVAEMRKAIVERDRAIRELQESKDEYLHRLLFKQVMAHLATEMSIEGALVGVYEDSIIIEHASMPLSPAGDTQELAGRAVIPRSQIGFVQELMPKT